MMDYETGSGYHQAVKVSGYDSVWKMKYDYCLGNIIPVLKRKFSKDEAVRILEIGPGLGIMAEVLHDYFSILDYSVIDIDTGILDRVKMKFPNTHVECITSINAYKNSQMPPFDVIIAMDVWEHLPPSDLIDYTKCCLGRLKPGGVLILQVPNWGCPFTPGTIFAGDLTHRNMFNEISMNQLLLISGADAKSIKILPYRFHGRLAFLRSCIQKIILNTIKLFCFGVGCARVSIMTPNLIAVVEL